jgi:hypothetical protein
MTPAEHAAQRALVAASILLGIPAKRARKGP